MQTTSLISRTLAICPFCGASNTNYNGPCPRCALEDTPETRAATKSRVGPWYVLQTRNPAAPGMKFEALLSLIQKGYVTPQSIVRGPTTNQLWQPAAKTRGVSREFGLCYSCDTQMDPEAALCPTCNRFQIPPLEPDALPTAPETSSESAIHITYKHATPEITPEPLSDTFSPHEMALIFDVDYDPNGKSKTFAGKSNQTYSTVSTLSAIAAALVIGWILWPANHVRRSADAAPATQPTAIQAPRPKIELVPLSPLEETPTTRPVNPAARPGETSLNSDVKKLWNQALDAESRRDFATAVKTYELVLCYPNSNWPPSLKTRLSLARQELINGTY